MAGTIVADKWQNGDGTENYKCRAWVNFNGTGTVAIRASGNVSSITDNGVGDYTINFTTAMPDANYNVIASGALAPGTEGDVTLLDTTTTPTTSLVRIANGVPGTANGTVITKFDRNYIYATIFR